MNIKAYDRTSHEKDLIAILKQPEGHYFTEESVDLSGFQEAYVYEAAGQLLGFLCIEVHERTSQIICYVSPEHRKKGIGSQLFEYGKSRLDALDPNTIWLFFRNDIGQSAQFYQKRGAKPWYSYHYMVYEPKGLSSVEDSTSVEGANGEAFDCVIPYSQEWFDTYLEVRASAFIKVNRMIDSRPYDERERREQIDSWTKRNEKDLWLFMKGDELIGSVAYFDGFLDEVFVKPEFQGQGIGKDIVKWALTYCEQKNWEPRLCVVTKNLPAIKLYESMGFRIAQTLEMNRLFSSNKAPDYSGPIGG